MEREKEIERRLVFYSFVGLRESLHNDADKRAEVERKQRGKECGCKEKRERKERRGLIVMEMGVALVVVVVFCLFVGRDAVTGRE